MSFIYFIKIFKVFENDLAVIGKKLQFIEEIIGDPLGLTQKSFGEMSEFCELLRNEVNSYQSKNTFNQNVRKTLKTMIFYIISIF